MYPKYIWLFPLVLMLCGFGLKCAMHRYPPCDPCGHVRLNTTKSSNKTIVANIEILFTHETAQIPYASPMIELNGRTC
jgi:hypothetical protein